MVTLQLGGLVIGYLFGLGAAGSHVPSQINPAPLGIPARCWMAEAKPEFYACRFPSLVAELDTSQGKMTGCNFMQDGPEKMMGSFFSAGRPPEDIPRDRVCSVQFHLDLEWKLMGEVKAAIATQGERK